MILQLVVFTPTQGCHSHSTQCMGLQCILLVQLASSAKHHTQHHFQRIQDNVLSCGFRSQYMILRFIKFFKHALISAAQRFWSDGNKKWIFLSPVQHRRQ